MRSAIKATLRPAAGSQSENPNGKSWDGAGWDYSAPFSEEEIAEDEVRDTRSVHGTIPGQMHAYLWTKKGECNPRTIWGEGVEEYIDALGKYSVAWGSFVQRARENSGMTPEGATQLTTVQSSGPGRESTSARGVYPCGEQYDYGCSPWNALGGAVFVESFKSTGAGDGGTLQPKVAIVKRVINIAGWRGFVSAANLGCGYERQICLENVPPPDPHFYLGFAFPGIEYEDDVAATRRVGKNVWVYMALGQYQNSCVPLDFRFPWDPMPPDAGGTPTAPDSGGGVPTRPPPDDWPLGDKPRRPRGTFPWPWSPGSDILEEEEDEREVVDGERSVRDSEIESRER
ncbi:MAG: hypothetical protein ACYTG4_04550 [Planctomycetota bacterium]